MFSVINTYLDNDFERFYVYTNLTYLCVA